MKTFNVCYTNTILVTYTVEAESEEQAIDLAADREPTSEEYLGGDGPEVEEVKPLAVSQ